MLPVSEDPEEGGEMMNQVTNLIQWKNLTQEQMDEFDFENYWYEWQTGSGVFCTCAKSDFSLSDNVYRLVIEDDKWYAMPEYDGMGVYKDIVKGSDIKSPEKYINLRPARLDEIPQPEKTLRQKIQEKWPDKEVVVFGWSSANIWGWTTGNKTEHIKAQSMRGFHTYVYQRPEDDSFFPDTKAIYCWNEFLTLQPVAVLFEAQK